MQQPDSVGIDVSADELEVAVFSGSRGRLESHTFDNTLDGHRRLIRRLTKKGRRARVAIEATGFYGLDLALALHRATRIEVMVLTPRVARHFAEALLQRSKTDGMDAEGLCEYVQRMPFVAWEPPRKACQDLRILTRRMHALVHIRIQEKNRLHTAQSSRELTLIRRDLEVHIGYLQRRIEYLESKALELVLADAQLAATFQLLVSVKGIGTTSALRILGELASLPPDMSPRQWVAHAGLDPKHHVSGSSVDRPTRISKRGNRYLRAALYMPAHVAVQRNSCVEAFYLKLLGRGKTKLQAKVAVMRKLLHSIHGMLRSQTRFDELRFFNPAATNP